MNSTKQDPRKNRAWFEKQVQKGGQSANELDDFERDALEGWGKSGANFQLLDKLDKKFRTRLRISKVWFYTSFIFIVTAIGGSYYYQTNTWNAKKRSALQTPILKNDVHMAKQLNGLDELPQKEQIKASKIVSDFKKKAAQEEQIKREVENVGTLPLKKVPTVIQNQPQRSKRKAKEIILSDLKLIDYRAYRSKPSIPDAQLKLSGTPANISDLDKIEVNDPAWENRDIPYHEYIEGSMDYFNAGNYKMALNRCLRILKSYPDDLNAQFYSGLCYYNLNEMNQAKHSFQAVLGNEFSNFDEEANWYLANTYLNLNQKEQARERYKEIGSQKGFYAKQAEEKLKMLK